MRTGSILTEGLEQFPETIIIGLNVEKWKSLSLGVLHSLWKNSVHWCTA